ncbi:MAG: cellulase family glycosylhydrolase [Candidatus Levybacteria bacterium]|nr:cellulase family glycosylhydrolase [Candidatus Levybacteria bacterium]
MSAPYKNKKRLFASFAILFMALFSVSFFNTSQTIDTNQEVIGASLITKTPPTPFKKLTPTSIAVKEKLSAPSLIPVKRSSSLSGLRVQGNTLVNAGGESVRLFGANRSGTEYACLNGNFSDGPVDSNSLKAMQKWHLNTVRVPLNESCWLGINSTGLGGIAYQNKVKNYVDTITASGMVAILDLHWNAPGTEKAVGQNPMPDADHTPSFWREVATTFKTNDKVIFDLFNEPDPIPFRNDYPGGFSQWQTDDFNCLLNGCEVTAKNGIKYQGIGMQKLVDVVRETGATNIIMIAGIQSAQTITQYQGNNNTNPKGYMPIDPLNNLAVAMHQYNRAACSDVQCWEATIAPVAAVYPIITGEFGDIDCTADYTKQLLPWLDKYKISYVGWTWDVWPESCEGLIKNYTGTPNKPYGQAYYNHLKSIH